MRNKKTKGVAFSSSEDSRVNMLGSKKAITSITAILVAAAVLSGCSLLTLAKSKAKPTAAASSQADLPTATIEKTAAAAETTAATAAPATASPTATPVPTPSPSPSPTPTAAPVVVSVKYIKVSDKYVDIKLAYPVISGMADTAFQKKLNASIKADMKKQSDTVQADAKSDYDNAQSQGIDYSKHAIDASVKVHMNNGTLLSLSIRMSIYDGGAHPYADSRFYAITNGEHAKRLTLPDLFTKPATGKTTGISRIEKVIKNVIHKSPDDYFETPAIILDKKTWFYISGTKLHIVFPSYSIAPGVAGEPEFSMPLASFKDILIAEVPH